MKYTFATNINNSGESGIIDMDSLKLLCICPEANSKIILQALNLADVSISLPSDEEIREPIQNALYSTNRFTTDQCTELADGILTYLNESGFKVVRQ